MWKVWQKRPPAAHYMHMAELPLVQAVVRDEAGAWDAFVQRYSDLVYSLCVLVCREENIEEVYLAMFASLRQERFAVLRVFDGRATLSTYLTMTLSNLLAVQLLALFEHDANRAWHAFERFFRKDILQVITAAFPPARVTRAESHTHDDYYQEISLLLIEHDYHRLKAYDGRGSFAAYLRSLVRRICVDLLRRDRGRRRLPSRVKELHELEQEAFKLIYWAGQSPEEGQRTLLAQGHAQEDIVQALARVQQAVGTHTDAPARAVLVPLPDMERASATHQAAFADTQTDPETALLTHETHRTQDALLAALREAVGQLPEQVQRYVHLRFGTTPETPPRAIALQMGCSVEEVYRLRHQAFALLKMYLRGQGL